MASVKDVEKDARNLIRCNLPELENAESHPDDDRRMVQSVFLGTVFSIMPSGKYYMPWACSNLELCPECEGEGWKGMVTCDTCNGKAYRTFQEEATSRIGWQERSGYTFEGEPVTETSLVLNRPPDCPILNMPEGQSFPCHCYGGEIRKTCSHCEGTGSREAYLDECFQAAMESEAAKNGSWVESGEGDPCDLFLFRIVD